MATELSAYRTEFPLTETWAYLNHAAQGLLPARTVAAISGAAQALAAPPTADWSALGHAFDTARENVAALVNGTPSQVALVSSLADAVSLAAAGIDWQPGDNVVIPAEEFPSVVYPFMNLQRQGVEIRFVDKDERGFTDIDRLADAIDDRTRALAISHVEFMTGFRNDLEAIGRLCRERDILSVVDATQSLGAVPIDVMSNKIDVIASHAYKWLMASFGLGVIHFSERAIERIHPTYVGGQSVVIDPSRGIDYDPNAGLSFKDGAERYQTGGSNLICLSGFNASATLLHEVGPARSLEQTLALTDRLIAGVQEMGYQLASCLDREHRSQIVSFTSGDRETDERIVAGLEERQVSVTLRGKGIRVSPYFYNTDADIDRLLESLPPR